MADIQLTIDGITKNFDLVIEDNKKAFAVVEEPIVPLKAATDVPGYGDLPAEKILAFVQNNWRGGMGQKNKFELADMYSEGSCIDTREPNMVFLGPKINTVGAINDTIIALEMFLEREYAASATKVYKLNVAGDTWENVLNLNAVEFVKVLEDCEDTWDEIAPSGVTSVADDVDFKLGLASAKLTVLSSVASGTIIGSKVITATNLTGATKIQLWIKSNVNTNSGDLKLLLDNHVLCASPEETLSIPALVADTWTKVSLTLANPASDTAIISVGLLYYTDLGACVLRLDDVKYNEIVSDTIECIAQYDGYLLVGLTTENYLYSPTGESGSWLQCTLDFSVAHQFCVSPPFSGTKDILVLAKRPNTVRTTLSPFNGGIDWNDPPYYISDENSDINSLFVLNGTLFIGKEDGVYALGTDGRPVALMPEFRQKRDTTNFKYWTMWQSVFYGALSGDIIEIVGGSSSLFSVDFVGPLEKSPELATVGSVKGLAADDKNVYALVLVGTDYIIYAGRERRDSKYGLRWEWVPYINLSTNVCGAIKVMQRDGLNPKLWFAYGTNMASVVLSRSPNSPLGDSNYLFTTQGYFITSYFDANYDTWSKIFYQLWLVTESVKANHQYIRVYYQIDTESDWILLTTSELSGTYSFNLPAISCNRIRLKIELNSDSQTLTPVLKMSILRGILRPEITRSIDFSVVLGQSDSRKVSSDLAYIRTGRTAIEPVVLKDLRFGTTRYITFLSNSPMELEDIDEVSKQPSYKARILAQELNWSPP